MSTIKIEKVSQSRISSLDFGNIPFGKVFTDHMFSADYDGEQWVNLQIIPVQNLSIHPGNLALHYGQSIFEGMKAFKNINDEPVLFRPELHSQRINASAHRMCMPAFPEELFLDGIKKLVAIEKNWIPTNEGSSLYLRPLMFATDEMIGVQASKTYKFLIMALPVGPYYNKPLKLKAETEYVRAIRGGVGEAKTAGNYAASLYPAKMAKEQGFDQIMWLDGIEFKYVQEVGTMNIFFVIDGKVISPETDGAILKGITRMTMLQILKEEGYEVEERKVSVDELFEAHAAGKLQEIFGTGTAAVISVVKSLTHQDRTINLDVDSYQVAPFAKSYITKLRRGVIEDTREWVHVIPQVAEAIV